MKNRIYCAFPWHTLQFHPDSSYGPCCRISYNTDQVPSGVNELMELYNSKDMIQLRTDLLNGKAPAACKSCYDRNFDTNHDIFAMGKELPRYSKNKKLSFEKRYSKANQNYEDGKIILDLPPLELYAYTSEACNLDCVMCTQNIKYDRFPVDRFQSLLMDLKWENLDRLGWIGGETFMTKDSLNLMDFVANSDTDGTCIYLTTNGTLLEKNLDQLKKMDNLFLTLSIDGSKKNYETIRKNASWDDLNEQLSFLKKTSEAQPHWRLNINSLLMKSSLSSLIDIMKLGEYLNATVLFLPIHGIYPDENIFEFNIVQHSLVKNYFKEAIEYAQHSRQNNKYKALDSLIKAEKFWRKQRFDISLRKITIKLILYFSKKTFYVRQLNRMLSSNIAKNIMGLQKHNQISRWWQKTILKNEKII